MYFFCNELGLIRNLVIVVLLWTLFLLGFCWWARSLLEIQLFNVLKFYFWIDYSGMGPMKLEFISESVSIWSDYTVDLEMDPKIPMVPFLCNQT